MSEHPTYKPKDLEQTILHARDGDPAAFAQLVVRFQNFAMAIAYGWLADRELARDVTQESFLDVYRQLPELRDPSAFSAWLRSIIIKHCDRMTRKKTLPDHLLPGDTAAPDPADLVEQSTQQQLVRTALEHLPQPERMVIALQYIAEATGPVIAAFLDLPLSTVKQRLRSARSHLRQFTESTMTQTMNDIRPSSDESHAIEIRFYIALRRGDLNAVAGLLEQHPQLLETPQEWGSDLVSRGILPFATKASPLITAIELDDLAMMNLLLDSGADVNGTCGCATGESPLWASVLTNRQDHTRMLLERGANPNQFSATGNLPLHLAAMRGFVEIAQLLLEYGADPSLPDQGGRFTRHWSPADGEPDQPGRTALDWAVAMGETGIVELLSHGAEQPRATTLSDIQLTRGVLLTGLKALDLFAPLPRSGIVRVPFKAGVGMVVLMGELCRRFVTTQSRSMIWTGFTAPPFDLHDWQADMAEFDLTNQVTCGLTSYKATPAEQRHSFETAIRQAEQLRDGGADVLIVLQSSLGFESDVDASLLRLKMPSASGSITTLVITPFPEVADTRWHEIAAPFDGQIMLDRARAKKHLYPAINPSYSTSTVLTAEGLGEKHARVAEAARAILHSYAERDPDFELQSQNNPDAEIAVRLLRYLCQPFQVTAPFTGRMGETVSIEQLLNEVEQILTPDREHNCRRG